MDFEFPDDPRSVLVAGDWHGNHGFAEQIIHTAAEQSAGVILHVGDLGFRAPGPHSFPFLEALEETLAEHDITLLWVDGNRDCTPALRRLPADFGTGVRPLSPHVAHLPRGTRWSWHGKTWLGLGGAYSILRRPQLRGVNWWDGEQLGEDDVLRAVCGGPVDVMITHDCPDRTDILSRIPKLDMPVEDRMSAQQHRETLGRVVDTVRPVLLFHGHYHVRYESQRPLPVYGHTRVVGLSSDREETAGNWVVLDLSRGLSDASSDTGFGSDVQICYS